ncbi:hypothetical protein TeGR_g1808 [Tetraparma gracilis]|uniref:START domain-containing protein n=1 Tax=Tetraparma gracilis TaxID=2962635 RepID=A0ABQ6ME92_9STRA|nr:hypothetical protein TeGR_g1808 [Tetraparma gracilis]
MEGTFTLTPSEFSTTDLTLCLQLAVSERVKKANSNTTNTTRSNTSRTANSMATTRQLGTDEAFTASQQEAEAVLDDLLQLVRNLHAKHARYDDVDAARLDAFIGQMESVPPPTKCENAAIDKALLFDADKVWNVIPGTINEPVSDLGETERRVLDECLALETASESIEWKQLKSDHTFVKMWSKHVPAARGERSVAWGKATTTLDCAPAVALAWSFDFCSRVRMQIDGEEGNPARVGVGQLVYLSRLRKRFDRSKDIDAASNLRLVTMIQNHDELYTEMEKEILRVGVSHFATFDSQKGKELKMDSALTKAKIAFEKGDGHAWGWAKTTVRASPEHVLAHVLDYYRRSKDTSKEGERSMKVVNDHNRELYARYKPGFGLSGRDFLNRQIWRKLSDSSFVIVAASIESKDHPLLTDVVRGRFPLAMRLRGNADGTTIENVIQIDFGGRAPALVTNLYMKSRLSQVTDIQVFHLGLRGLEEWDAMDGEAIGEVLVTKSDAEKHHRKGETEVEARVRVMMEKHKGLKELGEKHAWFELLLTKIVENKLRPAGDSKAKLCNMSAKQANVIGGALASCIAANLTAHAAVDEWILRYPAMGDLEREYAWFRPMMNTIAQRLLESVSWGLKMRLYTGAGLSTMDLTSDLYMIYTYATTGQQGTALSLAIMVGLCLLGQVWVCYLQTRKGPMRVMLKEMLIVMSGLAPGFHAMRVANARRRSASTTT